MSTKVRVTEHIKQTLTKLLDEPTFENEKSEIKTVITEDTISVNFLRKLCDSSRQSSNRIFFHELVKGSNIVLNPPPPEKPRSPELEARVAQIKNELANREYYKLVKDVVSDEKYKQNSERNNMKTIVGDAAIPLNIIFTTAGVSSFVYLTVMYTYNNIFWAILYATLFGSAILFVEIILFMVKSRRQVKAEEMELEKEKYPFGIPEKSSRPKNSSTKNSNTRLFQSKETKDKTD